MAVPTRRITLRYPAACGECGIQLPAGVAAEWSSETKRVRCGGCAVPAHPVGPAKVGRTAEVPDLEPVRGSDVAAETAVSDWAGLVGYHLACIERASVTEPALLSSDSWAVLPIEVEQLICGEADDVPLSEGLGKLIRTAGSFDSLYYGWPLVVVADRTGRSRVAPLVLTGLEGTPGASGRAVAKDDEPYLNAGLL